MTSNYKSSRWCGALSYALTQNHNGVEIPANSPQGETVHVSVNKNQNKKKHKSYIRDSTDLH